MAGQFYAVTPILEGPDSYSHFQYIRSLATQHQFPDINNRDLITSARQEAAQFPLYYLVAAAISWPISTADMPRVVILNPSGGSKGDTNRNYEFHRPYSGFPHGTELAARVIELFSLLCGLVTVSCAILLAWLYKPRRPLLWLGSGIVLSGTPAFDYYTGLVSNDMLVTALSSGTVVALACWLRTRQERWAWASAAGIGLASLAKLNAIGLAAVFVGAAWYIHRNAKGRMRALAQVAAGIVVLDGWWFLRDALAYGDPTGMIALNKVLVAGTYNPLLTPPADKARAILTNLAGTFRTFFVEFGVYNIQSPPALAVIAILATIGLAAGIVFALRRDRSDPLTGLLIGWPTVLLATIVGYIYLSASDGRFLFPAIAPLAVLTAGGWGHLARTLRAAWLPLPVAAIAVLVSSLCAWFVVQPSFAYPERIASLPASATPVQATFDGSVELLGAQPSTTSVQPGQPVQLTLYWTLAHPTEAPLNAFVHVTSLDPSYRGSADYEGAPGNGAYPPAFWQPGEIVVDQHTFTFPADNRPDKHNAIPLQVLAGMYDRQIGDTFHKVDASPPEAGDTGLPVALWKIPGHAGPAPEQPLAQFAAGPQLLQVAAHQAPPSGLDVSLVWNTPAPLSANLTEFVQLLDGQGHLVAQHDSYPVDGHYPTSLWSAGETVYDSLSLTLPRPVQAGDSLIAGLYTLPSAKRLLTTTGQDHVTIPL
ncbi:MAG TPA: hypothetical protein VFS62_18190 [Chloroflexota bacterium]|nr:hypothetical protein [Chloroflexota bacterium]